MNTDKISIPVDISIPAFDAKIKEAVDRLSARLKTELRRVDKTNFPGEPSVTGSEKFKLGSGAQEREFEIKGRAFFKKATEIGDDDLEMLNAAISEVREKLSKTFDSDTQRLKDFKNSIRHQPAAVQEKAIQDFLKQHGDINNELKNRLGKIGLSRVKHRIKGIDPEDAVKALDAYKQQVGSLTEEADAIIRQLQARIAKASSGFEKFKKSIRHTSSESQEKAIEDYLKSFPDIDNELTNRLTKLQRSNSRGKFSSTMKNLKALDPAAQIAELDRMIADPLNQFNKEMMAYRRQVARGIANTTRATNIEKQRKFSNQMMLGAGAGLGLLGNAGFPLLNIGFAAMAGGTPVTVGLVALATAVGVAVRAIESLSASTQAAAREIGFVPTSLKHTEAQNKALEAFVGLGGLNARQVELERRMEEFKEFGGAGMHFNEIWNNLKGSAKHRFGTALVGGDKTAFDRFINSTGGGVIGWVREFAKQNKMTEENRLPVMESALRNYKLEIFKPTVGIENDPFESWKRIQTAALDPTKAEEMDINRKQLKAMQELVDIEKGKLGASVASEPENKGPFWWMGSF